jgi:nitronate monooxygenase
MNKTREMLERLEMEHAIVQGPFGGGLSSPALVAAVSNRGGLGSYGAVNLAPEEIRGVARAIRALTARNFAMNLWVSDHDPGGLTLSEAEFERVYRVFEPYYRELGLARPEPPARQYHHPFEEQVEALFAADVPVFSFVFGVPRAAILAECRRRGITTIGAATSLTEAQALDAAGVDLIVASGSEAGGHRPSFLARAEESLMGTFALTPLIAERVRAPVLAAGGISAGRGVRAVLALGAAAAQIGSAFLACEESGASPAHRALLLGGHTTPTVLTRTLTGRLARTFPNRWTEELEARLAELPPFPIQSWFFAKLRAAAIAQGRTELTSLYASQAAPNLRHRTVQTLMEALVAERTWT